MAVAGDNMKCLICGGTTEKFELEKENVFICNDCGYGRPSIQEPIIYDESYEKKYLSYEENKINKIRFKFVAAVSNYYGTSINDILDFGCGSGSFVRMIREIGLTAYGFDVNDFTVDLRPPENYKPKIIVAWDSFEHLTDEQQKEFFDLAKNAKVICLSVPDFQTPNKNYISDWRHYRPGEHLHYYTIKSISEKFKQNGFQLVNFSHDEDIVRTAPWNNNILSVGFIK